MLCWPNWSFVVPTGSPVHPEDLVGHDVGRSSVCGYPPVWAAIHPQDIQRCGMGG